MSASLVVDDEPRAAAMGIVAHRGWWFGARVTFLAAVVQVFGAGLFVFGGFPHFHPVFGYPLGAVTVVLGVAALVGKHRRTLAGPALLGVLGAVLAPATVLVGRSMGALVASAHPVAGLVLVLSLYELCRRTRLQ